MERKYSFFTLIILTLIILIDITFQKINSEVLCYIFLITVLSSFFFYKNPFRAVPIFGLFLSLYTISFPLLSIKFNDFSLFSFASEDNIKTIIFSGLIIFLGILTAESIIYKKNIYINIFFKETFDLSSKALSNQKISTLCMLFFLPFFLLSIYITLTSQATVKYELSTSGIYSTLSYVFLAYYFIFTANKANNKNIYFFIFLLVFLLYYLITGERDFFVRAFLMFIAYKFYNGTINNKTIYIILIIGFLSTPISQALKGLLTYGGGIASLDISFQSLFIGEFMSQGRNFNWMLENTSQMNYIYDSMFWNDFKRFIGLNHYSSSSIFGTEIVGRTGGAGIGFSFPGQIYYSYGYIGLFIFGFLSGILINKVSELKKISPANIYLLITIIFSISYSLRADFANFLAGIFKVGLFPFFLSTFIYLILKNNKISTTKPQQKNIEADRS